MTKPTQTDINTVLANVADIADKFYFADIDDRRNCSERIRAAEEVLHQVNGKCYVDATLLARLLASYRLNAVGWWDTSQYACPTPPADIWAAIATGKFVPVENDRNYEPGTVVAQWNTGIPVPEEYVNDDAVEGSREVVPPTWRVDLVNFNAHDANDVVRVIVGVSDQDLPAWCWDIHPHCAVPVVEG